MEFARGGFLAGNCYSQPLLTPHMQLPGGDSSTKEVSSFAMSRQVHQEANTDLEPYAFQTFEAYERESVTPTQQIARSDEHESQEIPTIEHHTCPVCKRFSSDVRNLRFLAI